MITPAGLLFGFGLPDAPEGDDPFTLVYNSIWNLLLARPAFVESVKEKNRISFVNDGGGTQFTKDFNKLAADFPEVQIVVETASPHTNNTSSSSMIRRTYAIMVSTDGATLNPGLFPVEWEIYQAMAGWRTSVTALEYLGERFVKAIRLQQVTTGYTIGNAQVVKGWASAWRAEVDMHFSNVNLGV